MWKLLKQRMKKYIPKKILYYILNKRIEKHRKGSLKETFTHIYENNLWGKSKSDGFYSGSGTTHPDTERYKNELIRFILNNDIKSVFEIGCGDFSIMQAVLKEIDVKYIGSDIVPSLINYNNEKYGSQATKFVEMDAIEAEELPKADCCIIRQVLQHLNNQQIQQILRKTVDFKYILITEHLPVHPLKKNIDKKAGLDIRLYRESGVFLEDRPFSMACKTILEYRDDHTDFWGNKVAAIMRTSLINNVDG